MARHARPTDSADVGVSRGGMTGDGRCRAMETRLQVCGKLRYTRLFRTQAKLGRTAASVRSGTSASAGSRSVPVPVANSMRLMAASCARSISASAACSRRVASHNSTAASRNSRSRSLVHSNKRRLLVLFRHRRRRSSSSSARSCASCTRSRRKAPINAFWSIAKRSFPSCSSSSADGAPDSDAVGGVRQRNA